MKKFFFRLFFSYIIVFSFSLELYGEVGDLELLSSTSSLSDVDDLEELKRDLEVDLDYVENDSVYEREVKNRYRGEEVSDLEGKENLEIFDLGDEEKKLLKVSKYVEKKISEEGWNELASKLSIEKYTIVEGDYLWKIAQKLFGTGFYYSKIWALNPYIKNPHEVSPGMILIFHTGNSTKMPEIRLGSFNVGDDEGEEAEVGSGWPSERETLMEKGIHFQYMTDKTFEDLEREAQKARNKEYEKYLPPDEEIVIQNLLKNYQDGVWADIEKEKIDFKRGFEKHTFITTNPVQDLGSVTFSREENKYLTLGDFAYILFHPTVKVHPGDLFSLYHTHGMVSHPKSERSGYKYSVHGEVKVIRKVGERWECVVTRVFELLNRTMRVTIHTPKVDDVAPTFNEQKIEASVIGSFEQMRENYSFGDVVYIDRGRADGVEIGNVFEAMDFDDRLLQKNIDDAPVYKVAELTVITLTDNFATTIVSSSSDVISPGHLIRSMTYEKAALKRKLRDAQKLRDMELLEYEALEDLDVELNLEELNDDLLKKANQIKLSDSEMEEIERIERENSVLSDEEKDLLALERLEGELETVEKELKSSKIDEDKYLEGQDLNVLEKRAQAKTEGIFGEINEVEKEIGKKYLDEDLNSKENPYGLTEFDLEEVDELLNTTKEKTQ